MPFNFKLPGLVHQGFSQGVMALDKKLVTCVQTFKVARAGNLRELSANATVAVFTGQHEVPHTIEVHLRELGELSQGEWEKMIYVHVGLHALINQNVAEAVEASALLVAVQGGAATRNVDAGAGDFDEQGLQIEIVLDGKQIRGQPQRPCGLQESPAALGLHRKVCGLRGAGQRQQGVGERYTLSTFPVVHKEALWDWAVMDDMECVDDIIETEADGGVD